MMRRAREAVALEYGQRDTPVISAKGRDELADAIIRACDLAGALNLEQEIPRDLYTAVAVVLSWAYWLRGMQPGDEKS